MLIPSGNTKILPGGTFFIKSSIGISYFTNISYFCPEPIMKDTWYD
ncbi:hypothetical protein HMPREF1181_00730 [Bacteroides stercoris CC31F]|uniref:Uncharacterized protein n=1 Tax=Bacteroides stercoris CC31F TaxID=1073351 RepID=S3YE94_BACSE|nr:hypothetical protein HMPREF1181_00730 [Bacteroides stercoris CC31F]